jgi:hypothetical protein
MISRLIEHLEAALTHASAIQTEVDGDPDTWSDERWEEMHKGFEHAFSLAVAEAKREEMWPPVESERAPEDDLHGGVREYVPGFGEVIIGPKPEFRYGQPVHTADGGFAPSIEVAEKIIDEWAGVRTIHDAGGSTMHDTTGVKEPRKGKLNRGRWTGDLRRSFPDSSD